MFIYHAFHSHDRLVRFMLAFCVIVLFLHALSALVHGQGLTNISSDGSLGTSVTQIGNVHNIDGGTINGTNQFHSFDRFSVGTGDIASFNGPNLIENILSRVTGGTRSDIDGTLRSTIDGANLFFLNPAGVMFGPNASLEISGSFHVSTAGSLKFQDGEVFHANLSQDSVLSTAPVEAFGFLNENPSGITVNQSSLEVEPGKTISIIGGDIESHGNPFLTSQFIPTIWSPSGEIHLVSIDSPGEVSLGQESDVQVSATKHGEITLAPNTLVDVSGIPGGTVVIRSGRLMIDNAVVISNTIGNLDGASTAIDVQVADDVTVTNGAILGAGTFFGSGHSGRISIAADSVSIADGSILTTQVTPSSTGTAGDIKFEATNVMITNGALLSSSIEGPGEAGDVLVDAEHVSIADGAVISTITEGLSKGGDVMLQAKNINITNGATIANVNNGQAKAGTVKITAEETVILSGANLENPRPSSIFSIAFIGSTGDAGGIEITAKNVTVTDGAIIDSSTLGSGNGGAITVRADETVTLSGFGTTNVGTSSSGIRSISNGIGNTGDIVVEANNVTIADTARIDNSTIGIGDGGSIAVKATDSVELSDLGPLDRNDLPGGLFSETGGIGNGGDITIQAPQVELTAGMEVSAQSTGAGNAGGINITAADNIGLNDATITTSAIQASGGNIKLDAEQSIQLIDSTIEAKVEGDDQTIGGTISLDPQFITLQNSQLLATAIFGTGGTIELIGDIVLVDSLSTINASSQFGVSGSVDIQSPIQNLSGTIAPLPTNLLQIATMMTARCAAQKGGYLSSFVQAGRDTLPLEPEDFLASPSFLENPGKIAQGRKPDQSSKMFENRLGFTDPSKTLAIQNTFRLLSFFASPDCTS